MKHPDIPSIAYRLFRWFCRADYFEELEGDLEETFCQNRNLYGLRRARRIYFQEVLKMIRPSVIRKLSSSVQGNPMAILSSNFKLAVRNIRKQRVYSFINIFGLSTSLAISMLIILFLIDQDRMDEHNKSADRIFRIVTEYADPARDRVRSYGTSPYEFNQLVTYHVDDVEASTQLVKIGGALEIDESRFNFQGLYVSPDFLLFFDYPLVRGQRSTSLSHSNDVVVTEDFAAKTFNMENPIGEIISIPGLGAFSISGVVSTDAKSHLDFDLLLPIKAFERQTSNKLAMESWKNGWTVFYNYFRVKEGVDSRPLLDFLKSIDKKFPEDEEFRFSFSVQRLDRINLGRLIGNEVGATSPVFVLYFFIVLASVLMLSSGFNYVNLAVARGLKRAKEVGMRKIIGAGERQIFFQFLMETQVIVFVSFIFAVIFLQLMVPVFNDLKVLRDINGAITMNFNTNLQVYLVFFSFTFLVGLVAGIYPAAYLSSFRPLKVLKGVNNTGKTPSFRFRKILIFFQYSFSIIFIITALVLNQQARSFMSMDYGFDINNVMSIPMTNVDYDNFRNELLSHSEIIGVSAISNLPLLSMFEDVRLHRKTDSLGEVEISSSTMSFDPHTIENLKLQLISGNNFSEITDDRGEVILNKKAVEALGFLSSDEAIDQLINVKTISDSGEITTRNRIIGVVDDFKYEFVFKESGPLMIRNHLEKLTTMNVRFGNVPIEQATVAIESSWESFDPMHALEFESYEYMVHDIDKEFTDIANIVGMVAFFAMAIACLGQFSMVAHHIQLRIKEVGIRKVLGSDISDLFYLLSRDFLIIIILAVLVASPIAWKINTLWTGAIDQSVGVTWISLTAGIGTILLLSFGLIFLLVRKAALANPVVAIGYE